MVEPSTGNTPGTLQPETVSTKLRRIAMRVQQPLRASAAPRVRTAAVGGGIRERICQMKNRMREIRTSGSVRGEGGNPLAYSTWGSLAGIRGAIMQNKAKLGRTGACGKRRSSYMGRLRRKVECAKRTKLRRSLRFEV